MFSLVTVAELKPLANVLLALPYLGTAACLFCWRHRWSSWNEKLLPLFCLYHGHLFPGSFEPGRSDPRTGDAYQRWASCSFFCEYLGSAHRMRRVTYQAPGRPHEPDSPRRRSRSASRCRKAKPKRFTLLVRTRHRTSRKLAGMIPDLTISMYPGPRGNRHRPLNLTLIRPELACGASLPPRRRN